ncbi:short-chain dehydrogenase [Sphingorhabdus lutea]|uniref:Short-chain dehydrogenase n=1 Tax=Sphingorhabdus lutea TaxID=1913578 RepID=A0A1L3JDF7_9SPHN|nr:SDR family oxidoreductase [Sphingorhabdus lutea]APG63181.1 short-chain dehydrogenase [Sphingorhabdus lutea]
MQKLHHKNALITGGARGIGAAIAQLFAVHGAHIIIGDIDAENGTRLANNLGGEFVTLNVAKQDDWASLAEKYPQMDIVVNNAGITGFEDGPKPHDPENCSLADWHAVHAVNLDGVFLGCRYAIAAMRAKGAGSIINISSRSGLVGIPMAAAYASSKAAVRNHSKSVALYCAGQGLNIRCNSIHPAAILTPMWEAMIGDGPDREQRMAAFVADTPMKRFGTAAEVAALALLLASDDAAYITGSEMSIDGGLLAGSAASPGG